MQRRAIISALLLVGVGVLLGTTVFRDDIAQATGLAQAVTITNTPLPVREQNVDGNGYIKVHEQGTASVRVTNTALSVAAPPPITDGGALVRLVGGGETNFPFDTMASAITIHMTDGVYSLSLRFCSQLPCESGGQVGTVAAFDGPANFGNPNIDLALTRPIRFNNMRCQAASSSDNCSFGWIGNQP
jgi:hypothetical protein